MRPFSSHDPSGPARRRRTRIQQEKEEAILEAALDLFSENGFSGTTIDQIAAAAGMSKPNLLYYFASKEDLYAELLDCRLSNCFAPLESMRADGDPIEELRRYIRQKMQIVRAYPRESRIYANEVLLGAPRLQNIIKGSIRDRVAAKAAIIQGWIDAGYIVDIDPKHLILMIWAAARQYTSFDAEVSGVADHECDKAFEAGMRTVEALLLNGLRPR